MKSIYWDSHYFTSDFQKFFDKNIWSDTNNLDLFLETPASYKLAMIGKYSHGPEFDIIIQDLIPVCDKIIVFDSELHDKHVKPIVKYRDSKITWVIPGYVYGVENTIFNNQWLRGQIEMYRQPQIYSDLAELNPYAVKPYYFDALLGAGKPHKDYLAKQIRDDELENKILLRHGYKDFIFPQTITEGHGASLTNYKGWGCLLSTIVPLDIYNQTAYSIVGETEWDNSHFFLTEKTSKCLMSRRLFVMFSGQYWLRTFRDLGFKTFGSVIDESYDNIENSFERWAKAYAQVKYLCTLDQTEVLNEIRPILEYNYDLLWSTNWREILDQQVLASLDYATQTR
jgi:hypothetical protein